MNMIQAAETLARDTLPGILAAAGLPNVFATVDILEVPAALHNGPVVLVQPPSLDFTTYSYVQATLELVVIAGPPHDVLEAWRTIAGIQEALQDPLSLDTARPATFEHPGLTPHAAYALEFTDTI